MMDVVTFHGVKPSEFLNLPSNDSDVNCRSDDNSVTMVTQNSSPFTEGFHDLGLTGYTGGPIETSVVDFISERSLGDNIGSCDDHLSAYNNSAGASNSAAHLENCHGSRELLESLSAHDSVNVSSLLSSCDMKMLVTFVNNQATFVSERIIYLAKVGTTVEPADKFFLIPLKCLKELNNVNELVPQKLDINTCQSSRTSGGNTEDTMNVNDDGGDSMSIGSSVVNSVDDVGSDVIDVRAEKTIEDCSKSVSCMAQEETMDKVPVITFQKKRTPGQVENENVLVDSSNSLVFESCDVNSVVCEEENEDGLNQQTYTSNSVEPFHRSISSAAYQLSLLSNESLEQLSMEERVRVVSKMADSMHSVANKRWSCCLCEKSYTTKHNLVVHVLGHFNIRPHSCSHCGKLFKQVSHLRVHVRTHNQTRPYKCALCEKAYNQSTHLKRHMTVHSNGSDRHRCERCRKCFESSDCLNKHECGSDEEAGKQEVDNKCEETTVNSDRRCPECGQEFPYPSLLRDHMAVHTGNRPHICHECGMEFRKPHHLRAHQLTHSTVRPHTCFVCGRGFTLKSNMERHLLTHNPRRQFKCDECGRRFNQKQTLQEHLLTHSQLKPFHCHVCGRSFNRSHSLQAHLSLHSMSKKYVCFCGCSFTLKGNLNRHQKNVHKMSKFTCTSEYSAEEAARVLNLMSQQTVAGKGDEHGDDSNQGDNSDSGSPEGQIENLADAS